MQNATHSASDPAIRTELLAVALDMSREGIEKWIRAGHIPQRTLHRNKRTVCWPLSTLRAWNPRVAKRLDMLLIALA